MRCPKCRTLVLLSAGEVRENGSVVRCPRCPAAWLARAEPESRAEQPLSPPLTRRGPLIIDGVAQRAEPRAKGEAPGPSRPRRGFRSYGVAAGAAALIFALVAVVLLAPEVSALPVIALLEGTR
jgi:predicted Zn finger-like uncharacterized protein